MKPSNVDCVVSISNNFFYTRSLPYHLWFFNKGKKKTNKDKILMIDDHNVHPKVSSTILTGYWLKERLPAINSGKTIQGNSGIEINGNSVDGKTDIGAIEFKLK